MTFLIDAAIRSSVPVLVALLASLLLRRRSAALRHSVLAGAVVAAVAVVPLSSVLPSWSVSVPVASVESFGSLTPVAPTTGRAAGTVSIDGRVPTSPGLAGVVSLVWIAGFAIGMAWMLFRLVHLVRVTRRAEAVVDGPWPRLTHEIAAQYGIRRPIILLTTRAPDILATWGVLKPRVLLPMQALTWTEERVRVALCHELAHISRFDWPLQVCAEVLRTLFWFNPLFWMLRARLREEAECACDDVALGAGLAATTYASHVVEIAKACRPPSARVGSAALSIARRSTLEGRVTAMLNPGLNRQTPTSRTMAAILAMLAVIVYPAASFEVSAQDAGPRALTGYVYDSTGSVLPAVEVTLIDGRLLRWSTVTDGSGRFEFTPVGGGKYELVASLPGFRNLQTEFTLAATRDWDRSVTMQVGSLEETVTVTAKRPTAPAPAFTTGRGGPIRVGGSIRQPRKIKHANPVYPPAMRDAGLEGVVPMEALIAQDGAVASVRVLSAQVHPAFASAAEAAVHQWVFSPTLLNGVPVEVQMAVSVRFSLED